EMVELARARNIYDALEVGEITQWLYDHEQKWDMIATCDCLIYFGDLHAIVAAAAKRLKPGGIFALSMELGERPPYSLTDTARYAHHPDHVREAAKAADLRVGAMNEAFLRMEYGVPVTGLFAVLQKEDH